jgi:hypothetical protein
MKLSRAGMVRNFSGNKATTALVQPEDAMDTFWNICCAVFVCMTWFRAGRRNERSASGAPPEESTETKHST